VADHAGVQQPCNIGIGGTGRGATAVRTRDLCAGDIRRRSTTVKERVP
jgi:hypothetical protein